MNFLSMNYFSGKTKNVFQNNKSNNWNKSIQRHIIQTSIIERDYDIFITSFIITLKKKQTRQCWANLVSSMENNTLHSRLHWHHYRGPIQSAQNIDNPFHEPEKRRKKTQTRFCLTTPFNGTHTKPNKPYSLATQFWFK